MRRLLALLFIVVMGATSCAGRGATPLASPAADNLAREPVSHLQRSIIRSNSRTSPKTDPASGKPHSKLHSKPHSKQDVQRLYRTYRQNGGRLLLSIAPQTDKHLTQGTVIAALQPDFDALYLLLKAAPDSLVRIQATAPENARTSASSLASKLLRYLQQSCNLAAERCSIQATTVPPNKGGEVRLMVTAPHVPSVLPSVVAEPAPSDSQPRPATAPVTASAEAVQNAPVPVSVASLQNSTKDVTLYFNSGRAALEPGMAEQVAQIAAQLKAAPYLRARIEGYSDNVGNSDTNRLLSYQRALAVQIELIAAHGLAAERLEVLGLGEAHPLGNNSTSAGRGLNRRVEVHLFAQPALANSQATWAEQKTHIDIAQNGLRTPSLAQHVSSTPVPQTPRIARVEKKMNASSGSTAIQRGGATPLSSVAEEAAPLEAATVSAATAHTASRAAPDLASRFNLRMGAAATRGHFVGTNLAPSYAKPPVALTTYTPLSQQPRKFRIEVSISKCALWLYEIMADGSKRLVRPFQVATAKPGTSWPKGEGRITAIDHSPWWYPTQNMKRRARKIGKRLVPVPPGSPSNPMGAVKIMLSHMNNGGAYRIHGTNQPWLIGKRVSLGCIRMRNEDSLELARLVPVGTVVDIQY